MQCAINAQVYSNCHCWLIQALLEAFLKGLLLCFQLDGPDSECQPLLTAIVSELYRGLSSSQSTLGVASPPMLQSLAACLKHGQATFPNMASHSSVSLCTKFAVDLINVQYLPLRTS